MIFFFTSTPRSLLVKALNLSGFCFFQAWIPSLPRSSLNCIRSSLEHLLNNTNLEIIKVAGLGNTWIEGSASILDDKSKKKLLFVEPKEADYLITIFKPQTGKKIIIDTDKFSKYYDLVVDDNIVKEFTS